ncbi:hypothetical protein [Aerosakkonema funiforme]|uniref:hypothetical protein n=1 Tax=Aerosakkonema funiforme TaxID=1246630 RepID=UPI0035B7B775
MIVTFPFSCYISPIKSLSVATTLEQQAELIEQVILTEAQKDAIFKQFFIQPGQQFADLMPNGAIAQFS